MKFSKLARVGMMVVRHGDKYVRFGRQRTRQIVGVRVEQERRIIVTDAGSQEVITPAGVQVYGPAMMRIASK